jgi:hypothetical protein
VLARGLQGVQRAGHTRHSAVVVDERAVNVEQVRRVAVEMRPRSVRLRLRGSSRG